jgi:hypothetical protein
MKNRSLLSGNTFKAKLYSDGRKHARMMPDYPMLTACPECEQILWLKDLKEIPMKKQQAFREARHVEHPDVEKLQYALEKLLESPFKSDEWRDRNIFIRKRIWWEYNTAGFQNVAEMERYLENCEELHQLLDFDDEADRCLGVELQRNLCFLPQARRLAHTIPDNMRAFRERQIEECDAGNPLTVQLNQEKKEIKVASPYDIMINRVNELLICLNEHEGVPENPEIVYDGGPHALLYRHKNQIVILDFVHQDARKPLEEVDQLLVVEFRRDVESRDVTDTSNIVREYWVPVNVFGALPDERGLRVQLPVDETEFDLPDILPKDEAEAQLKIAAYIERAEKCDAAAQFALSNLYYDDAYKDHEARARWMYYAAILGFKPAVALWTEIFEEEEKNNNDAGDDQ